MLLILCVAIVSFGCGEVIMATPNEGSIEQIDGPAPFCEDMQCDLTVCGICQVCGETELTCKCYKLHYDGRNEQGVSCVPPEDYGQS